MALLEYAPHNTLLVGSDKKALKILDEIEKNPHLLYQVIGFVAKVRPEKKMENLPYLGSYRQISKIIRDRGIVEVIIAIDDQSPDEVLNIVAQGENMRVSFKVIPEMYDVISGLKTEEVLGHPLIRLFPEHMLPWQWLAKRIIDFCFAFISLVFLSPIFLFVMLFQMAFGIQPFFKIHNRVGRNGRIFGLVQFNVGEGREKFESYLKKLKFHYFPSLLNVIMGTMSIVGPNAETRETADKLKSKIRFYNRRFMIRPGITGWAQLKVPASNKLEIKTEQFRQDLFYLENMSLGFDLRIIIRAIARYFIRLTH
jgi:lipopolysaccharide/colanic/teichoic acid biosynthesis glycosyltransferase